MDKRALASRIYPRHSRFVELLNRNPLFQQYVRSAFKTAKPCPHRGAMYEFLNTDILGNCPIAFLEFGVYSGDTILLWARINTHPESRFIGFDTFQGLPERWTDEVGVGAFSTQGRVPQTNDSRICFVKGLFQNTLRPFLKSFRPSHRLIVHVDCDLYTGALFALASLDEYLAKDSIVLFDEFNDLEGEFAAWSDYRRAFYREANGLAFTPKYSQVALRVA
jgi:O-methyltransferase